MPVIIQKKKDLKLEYGPLDKALLEKKRRELRIPKPKRRENIVFLIDKKENKKETITTILKRVVGCGLAPVKFLPKLLGIPYNKTHKINSLNPDQKRMYTDLLQKYNFDFEAKDESEIQNRLRLDRIKPLRQWRYLNRLPCRGQRTKTNAQTAKSRFKVTHVPRTGIADKLRKSDIQNNKRINE